MTYKAIEYARKLADSQLTTLKEVLKVREERKMLTVGDTCRLKHGYSPVMTITSVTNNEIVRVVWFNKAGDSFELKNEHLPLSSLVQYPPKEDNQ
jgi:uncharacterized protein YodC (DUF2158 family)